MSVLIVEPQVTADGPGAGVPLSAAAATDYGQG